MRTVIGFDGGGSRCEAFWVDESGAILDQGRGGATHEWYGEGARAGEAPGEALAPMLERRGGLPDLALFTSPGGGVAFESFRQLLAPARVQGCGEAEVQLAAARRESGLLILAGTGSFAHGRTSDGRRLTLGGAGPVIGDDGSGFDIGILAIRAACLAGQLPSRATPLAEAVRDYLGVGGRRWDLVTIFHLHNPGRRRIAGLAPIVCAHAERGDASALAVLDAAASKLAGLAALVVEELGMEREADVILAGGVSRAGTYRAALLRRLAPLFAVPLREHRLVYPPAIGAALLGLAQLGAPLDEAGHERLAGELRRLEEHPRPGAS